MRRAAGVYPEQYPEGQARYSSREVSAIFCATHVDPYAELETQVLMSAEELSVQATSAQLAKATDELSRILKRPDQLPLKKSEYRVRLSSSSDLTPYSVLGTLLTSCIHCHQHTPRPYRCRRQRLRRRDHCAANWERR